MQRDGTELVDRLVASAWRRGILANIVFVSTYFLANLAWQRVFFEGVPLGGILRGTAIAFAVGLCVASLIVLRYARHIVRRASRWIVEDRPPTRDELSGLASLPRRVSLLIAANWTLSPIIGIPVIIRLYSGTRIETIVLMKALAGWAVLALCASSLTYLIVERTMRPLRAMAMATTVPDEGPRTMGLTPKLLLAWLAVAGLPFAAISFFLVGIDPAHRAEAVWIVWEASGVAVIAGIVVTAFSARAITDPLNKVRAGLRSVGAGDLNAAVDIDEVGELGDLQVGFNRMVEGLRERERMRDIFGRHVGTAVAQRAMEADAGLGGELCEASALFVDVIGSTVLAQQRSPDDVVAILNAFFETVVRAVESEGGLVSKFDGDGALCIFGAPHEQPDHAARALRTAGKLRDALGRIGESVDAGIGVSSGEVVAGNVGAADRYEYTVIGDPVNEAKRLTDEAKARMGRVLASDRTLALAGAEGESWTQAGTILLRGRSEPTVAFEPTARE